MDYSKELAELCRAENPDIDRLINMIELNCGLTGTLSTYLGIVAECGNVEFVRVLLENGADPNYFDEYTEPPVWDMQYAPEYGEEKWHRIVKLMFDYGAKPYLMWECENILDYTVYRVFNDIGDNDWEYAVKFLIYLIAYGGCSEYCTPEIYEEFDKNCLEEYTLSLHECEDGYHLYGVISRNGKVIAKI